MIGKLRHRVALQTESTTRDAGGGQIKAWATQATVWARVEPLRGFEQLQAMQHQESVTHRVTIRYRSDVIPTPKGRVEFGTRLFNIKSVLNVEERGKFLVMLCEEGKGT